MTNYNGYMNNFLFLLALLKVLFFFCKQWQKKTTRHSLSYLILLGMIETVKREWLLTLFFIICVKMAEMGKDNYLALLQDNVTLIYVM